MQQGELLPGSDAPEEGIDWVRRAMRLQSLSSRAVLEPPGPRPVLARAYGDAIASYSKLTAPDYGHHAFLAASLAQVGNRVAAVPMPQRSWNVSRPSAPRRFSTPSTMNPIMREFGHACGRIFEQPVDNGVLALARMRLRRKS